MAKCFPAAPSRFNRKAIPAISNPSRSWCSNPNRVPLPHPPIEGAVLARTNLSRAVLARTNLSRAVLARTHLSHFPTRTHRAPHPPRSHQLACGPQTIPREPNTSHQRCS
ncbi:pentapeptide repeat-containing protein [Planctomycetes bacterium SV_7m_r]|uniref:pentapeptide repeat-containing protein n=1 Tax=Stieleria bergensis TaxID=2528025 RepID=UPI0011A6431B